jgi:hypothetical protein
MGKFAKELQMRGEGSSLETVARDLMERQWEQLVGRAADGVRRGQDNAALTVGTLQACCINDWLLHDLLELIRETHDCPVEQLRPVIRQRIGERTFFDDSGDSAGEWDRSALLEQELNVLVDVLEQVRQHALECGEWSEAPVAPQMFG